VPPPNKPPKKHKTPKTKEKKHKTHKTKEKSTKPTKQKKNLFFIWGTQASSHTPSSTLFRNGGAVEI
jgi:hypothetical protein